MPINPYESPRCEHADSNDDMPWWVQISLLGSKRRWQIWFWFWFAIVSPMPFLVIAAVIPTLRPFAAVAALALGAVPYWCTIRWMDRRERWPQWERKREYGPAEPMRSD